MESKYFYSTGLHSFTIVVHLYKLQVMYIYGVHIPVCVYIYIFQEYEEPVYSYSTYPGGDNPRVNPNILKCPFHSLVGEGVSASGGRLQSDSVQYTHLLPHSYSLAFARGCVILQLTHSLSSFAYFSFISSYFTLIILSEVL